MKKDTRASEVLKPILSQDQDSRFSLGNLKLSDEETLLRVERECGGASSGFRQKNKIYNIGKKSCNCNCSRSVCESMSHYGNCIWMNGSES